VRKFRPKREEVAAGWRKLHNEELHILYTSPYIIVVTKSRKIRWAGHVACMGEMRNVYKILVTAFNSNRPQETSTRAKPK
jgi:hypothetical protein